MREPKYPKSTQVLDIIASELHLPKDASLSDILVKLYLIDKDGEVMNLFRKIVSKELCEKILADIG